MEDGPARTAGFANPFGVAVDQDGNILIAEGGESNRIRRITREGIVETVAGYGEGFRDGTASQALFNTLSGIAAGAGGDIVAADTANNRIRAILPDGTVVTLAGNGNRGLRDGARGEAEFDSPLGVAVDDAGAIYVADTYNDAIRVITPDGRVATLAGGGSAGFADGSGSAALFDTPSGIAVDNTRNIFVADTGNDAIRKITIDGHVSTVAAYPEIDRPVGLAVSHDGFLWITEENKGRVTLFNPSGRAVRRAGSRPGFKNGVAREARFNGPTGIAVDYQGNAYVADTQNNLVRRISPHRTDADDSEPDRHDIPRIDRSGVPMGNGLLWPFDPQDQPREITGVLGEARGAPGGVALHHLHGGVDIRGTLGEPVLSVLDEKVSSPISAWDFGSSSEGIQVGLLSYFHIRVGRDSNNRVTAPDVFKPSLDATGAVTRVRVRRGTRFKLGHFLGTINPRYHVHFNVGPWNAQVNPLQFPFVGLIDTTPPTVEQVEIIGTDGSIFGEKRNGRLVVWGDLDIIVTAYDRMDDNAAHRRLGIYRLGYQLLNTDRSPARGFEEPLMNAGFDKVPADEEAVFSVYAAGSGVSAYGTPTRFRYFATNRIKNGEVSRAVFRSSDVTPGDYILSVTAEDYAGNRASGDMIEVPITIEHR